MDLTNLKTAVSLSVETIEGDVGFRVNMTKLTQKADELGYIPLWYRSSFNSRSLRTEDASLLSAFVSGKDLSWFSKEKHILTLIFISKENVDEDLQEYLDQLEYYRKNTKPINYPSLHDRLLHYGTCIYTEDDRAINVVNTIVSKYETIGCLIGKGANILIKFRDSEGGGAEIVDNPTAEFDAIVEVDGKAVYYKSIIDAVDDIAEGGTLTLNNDVTIDGNFKFTKNCTIEAPEGKTYSISTSDDFSQTTSEINALIGIDSDIEVTFRNVTINSGGKIRGIIAKAGKISMENCTITGNKHSSYPGGLYLTNGSEAVLTNCTIVGNEIGDDYVDDISKVACKDLWVGANAKCVLDNCEVENAYVNANEYSASNKGYLEVRNATKIDKVYLEYDKGFGADMIYQDGYIGTLNIVASDGSLVTVTEELEPGKTYSGGISVGDTSDNVVG